MDTYDGRISPTDMPRSECTIPKSLTITDTVIDILKMQMETINTLNVLCANLFGDNENPSLKNDAQCLNDNLIAAQRYAEMIMFCVKSVTEKIGS